MQKMLLASWKLRKKINVQNLLTSEKTVNTVDEESKHLRGSRVKSSKMKILRRLEVLRENNNTVCLDPWPLTYGQHEEKVLCWTEGCSEAAAASLYTLMARKQKNTIS